MRPKNVVESAATQEDACGQGLAVVEFSMWRPFWIVDVCLVPVCDIAPNGRCEGDKGEEDTAGIGHVVRQKQSIDENDVGDEKRRRGMNRLRIRLEAM